MAVHKTNYDIQELVTESGVPRRTVYFYVQQGILPPPQGAGLAAYYTEEHLLRLKMIPILRREGLRLDDIRERLGQMGLDEMRKMVRAGEGTGAPAPQQLSRVKEWSPPAPHTVQEKPGVLPGWREQSYVHYELPAGITLSAPAALSPTDRQRLNLLLQAARQIFAGGMPPIFTSHHPTQGRAPDRPEDDSDDTGAGGNHA